MTGRSRLGPKTSLPPPPLTLFLPHIQHFLTCISLSFIICFFSLHSVRMPATCPTLSFLLDRYQDDLISSVSDQFVNAVIAVVLRASIVLRSSARWRIFVFRARTRAHTARAPRAPYLPVLPPHLALCRSVLPHYSQLAFRLRVGYTHSRLVGWFSMQERQLFVCIYSPHTHTFPLSTTPASF